jgi:peroxiredoxin
MPVQERLLLADSVEKVAPLSDLRQNCFIGRWGITEHDGTVIEWAGAAVLLVQP